MPQGVPHIALLVTSVAAAHAQTRQTPPPPEPKRLSVGAVIGFGITGVSPDVRSSMNTSATAPPTVTGLRASDDVGIKVDVEFRYTRWADPIFQPGPANSNNNQADVMVAFTI